MSREKPIESLVHEIRCGVMKGGNNWRVAQIAEHLYDAGYRKHEKVEHIQEIISLLSEMKAGYSIFDTKERPKYHALSVAIRVLNEIKEE